MRLTKLDRWGKSVNRVMDRSKGIAAAFLFFAFIAWFAYKNRAFDIYNDAKLYYLVSEQFINNGRISFVAYHDVLRAYTWPFILLPIRVFAGWLQMNPAMLFRLVFGLVSGVFFGILLPNGIEKIFRIKVNFLQRLLFAGLLLLFWAPTFLQPLTDMPAFMFNIYGIILIFYALDAKKAGFPLALGRFGRVPFGGHQSLAAGVSVQPVSRRGSFGGAGVFSKAV